MNAQVDTSALDVPPAIGTALGGGFYTGRILTAGILYALVSSPKAFGEHAPIEWSDSYKMVTGATSWNDGLANTIAIAKAGSKLAQWALDLRIGGFDDWYLAALDEQELQYRYLKPTSDGNYLWSRSGINVSAVPPTYPYTTTVPSQTVVEAFRAGGNEAFEEGPYWSSTQHASGSTIAWSQDFGNGSQYYWFKVYLLRARAVRRLAI